jgi:hypothetical protein
MSDWSTDLTCHFGAILIVTMGKRLRDEVTPDHPIDHRERLWDRRSEIAPAPFLDFPQKNFSNCGNCLHLEFGLIQPFAVIEHLF